MNFHVSLTDTEKEFKVKFTLPPAKTISPTFRIIEVSYLIYATCLAPAVVNGAISLRS